MLSISNFLDYHLIHTDKYKLTLLQIVATILIIVISIFLYRFIRKVIYKDNRMDIGKKFAISQVIRYLTIFITLLFVFRTLGVNISPVLLGGSAILVGIGLGLQNLVLDFVSGIILLMDKSIQANDVVQIGDIVGRVREIKFRTSIILTRENTMMIVPNSVLTKNHIVNLSYGNNTAKFSISIKVAQDVDVDLLQSILLDVAKNNKDILQDPPPKVDLKTFDGANLKFALQFNTNHIYSVESTKSKMRLDILEELRKHDIKLT